jgi:hypothetical protein
MALVAIVAANPSPSALFITFLVKARIMRFLLLLRRG